MYKHPGVYIEHVPSGQLAIEAASTAVAAFIGHVKRGDRVTDDKEDGKPVFVSSQAQYAKLFGELDGKAGGLRNEGQAPDEFGHAVQAFFANGGGKAYIVPVNAGNGVESSAAVLDPVKNAWGYYFTAASSGVWADGLVLRLILTDKSDEHPKKSRFDVLLGLPDGRGGLDPVLETHSDVGLDPNGPRLLTDVINAASELVSVEHKEEATNSGKVGAIEGGKVTANPADVKDKILTLKFGGDDSSEIDVEFKTAPADVAEIAQTIESQVRQKGTGGPIHQSFTVTVTDDTHLVLIPGYSEEGKKNTVSVVTGGQDSAASKLALGSTTSKTVTWDSSSEPTDIVFTGGKDTKQPKTADYKNALIHLRDYRDISIMLLPGKVWAPDGDNGALEAAITHAEFMQNRMVLIDPPEPKGKARLISPADVTALGAPTSPYTALYYPWLEVANPFHDPDTAANLPKTFNVPAGAFAAGLWARIDARRGVWKAPAGLEATVRGAIAPTIDIGADLQDNLNEFGVNCLRAIIGPTVIWGARTRATKTKPEYRYVPVRRTQSMIGESLYNALQAVVFEPNDHKLWSSLRANVEAFLDTLHRAGAFQGEKASDAYYVQCGLGTTMTQADIDAGVVRVVAGFAPLKPAEFVVVQIKQIVGQTA